MTDKPDLDHLRQYVESGWLSPSTVTDKIFEVAESHGLTGEPGSDKEAAVMQIAMSTNRSTELHPEMRSDRGSSAHSLSSPPSLETKTPAAWKGTEPLEQRWQLEIPLGQQQILHQQAALAEQHPPARTDQLLTQRT